MRHKSNRLRLNQKPDHARHIKRNMVTSLFLYESIRTTRKKARIMQPIVDRLITIAKTKTPTLAIRAINLDLSDKNASKKLMEVLSKRYATRTSGFTRVVPVGARKGDGAQMVDLTLVDAEIVQIEKSQKSQGIQKSQKKVVAKKSSKSSESSDSSKSSLPTEAPAGAKAGESSK